MYKNFGRVMCDVIVWPQTRWPSVASFDKNQLASSLFTFTPSLSSGI